MKPLRVTLASLLAASAIVFAIGVAVERSQSTHHDESAPSTSAGSPTQAPEGSAEREAGEKKPAGTTQAAPVTETSSENSEKVFGVNTESIGLVLVVVVASLLLAASALVVRSPLILGAIIAVALAATVFDAREIAHQLDESRNGVATLAALTMTLHILVALVAAGSAVAEQREAGASGHA
jgi:hypothetical protein